MAQETYRGVPLDQARSLEATIDDAFDAGYAAGTRAADEAYRRRQIYQGEAKADPLGGIMVVLAAMLCGVVVVGVAIKALL